MPPKHLDCTIVGYLIHNHCHFGNKTERFVVKKEASTDADWDEIDEAIDSLLQTKPFIIEDSNGLYLSQRDYGAELVNFYEQECGENPQWFKERLDHVPNVVWFNRGLSPPSP